MSPFAVLKLGEQIATYLDDKPVEPRRTVQFILTGEEPNQEVPRPQISLVELREAFVKSMPSPASPESQFLGAKQGIYLESTDRVVAQIPNEVSSSEYALIANEHLSVGNFTKGDILRPSPLS